MKNSIDYRESRYFKADNEACCRYYFVTICFGNYVEEVLQELSVEPTDIIVMNSLLWDVHRHGKKGIEHYEQNLEKLVAALRRLLPDCLFIWLTTPPVDIKSKGGFLMRPGTDMVKVNEVKFCNEIAREVFTNANNIDRRFRIVDLDAVFKYFEHHRATDGVHWNERAHRRMSNMILEEVSKAFNKTVPRVIGRYDSMWDEGNRPHNEYENFNDPQQPNLHWNGGVGMEDHGMGWGPHHPHHEHDGWNQHPQPYENSWGPGPMGPPPPHAFGPFGMPFGHGGPPPLPPALCPDLDDLGQARHLVEYQEECRKRKRDSDNESSIPEKKYRFGVTPRKKESKSQQDEEEQNMTVVEVDGVMKKLVKLGDGVVCHAVMKEEEIKKYKQKLEKERLAKLKKEKEEEERKEKKRLEEKRKKEAEEKAKLAEKVKTVDVSQLPLVSEVPAPTSFGDQKKKVESKAGVSKIASKLLSFIKNPIDTIKGTKKSAVISKPTTSTSLTASSATTSTTNNLTTQTLNFTTSTITTTTDSTNVTVAIIKSEKPEAIINKLSSIDLPVVTNLQMEIDPSKDTLNDIKPPIVPPTDEKPTNIHKQLNTENRKIKTEPISDTILNVAIDSPSISLPDPPKPVDTLALLASLNSPFAKPKAKPAPPLPQSLLSLSTSFQTDDSLLDSDDDESMTEESLIKKEVKSPVSSKKRVAAKTSTPAKAAKPKAVAGKNSPRLPTVSSAKKEALLKKKEKKKSKHPGETKEEKKLRKQKKKERKEKIRAERESKKNQPEALQSISTVTGNVTSDENSLWNNPLPNHDMLPTPRVRSATWTPSYYPTYSNQLPQPQIPGMVQQPQAVIGTHLQQHQQQPLYAANPMMQQVAASPQQHITPTKQQQLYIDEYGQTYTLEEETYVVGPTGHVQAVNQQATPQIAAQYLQQQQTQQQQQQFGSPASSLIYGQQQVRYM